MNYNLLVARWIPVLGSDGGARRMGMRDALTQSDVIRQIATSNRMDDVALMCLLLAVRMKFVKWIAR